ncbi:MAG: transposase [Turneriella sp.]|nr:transposase [Turneriella sp.]
MAHQKINFVRPQQQIDRHDFHKLQKEHFRPNSERRLSHWQHFSFWLYALAKQATVYAMRFRVLPQRQRNSTRGFATYRALFFSYARQIPHKLPLTHACDADVKIAHRFSFESGITYVMDRGYTDSQLWRKIADNAEVSDIYRKRWAIELFFKWLKQNLKLRRMYGFSENAVQLQIWISLIFYLLLWHMYAMVKEKVSGFLEFLRRFRSRLLLSETQPEKKDKTKWPPDCWLPGLPPTPAEQ